MTKSISLQSDFKMTLIHLTCFIRLRLSVLCGHYEKFYLIIVQKAIHLFLLHNFKSCSQIWHVALATPLKLSTLTDVCTAHYLVML